MTTDRIATRPRERVHAAPGDGAARRDGVDPEAIPEERRASAMARHILRRAGIAPLVPILAAFLIAAPTPGRSQTVAEPRAIGTARAVILPSSARVEGGRLLLRDTMANGPLVPPPPIERACAPEGQEEAPSHPATCRLLVFDLP